MTAVRWLIVVLFVSAAVGFALASPAAAQGAGTSIGNAAVLTGQTTGTIVASSQNDWYVVYPLVPGGSVEVSLTNTTPTTSGCLTIGFEITNANGTDGPIEGPASLGDGDTVTYTLTGSSLYYVLVNSAGGCAPPVGQPIMYSLDPLSGAGLGPNLPVGAVTPGASIGSVGAPLDGGTIYDGAVTGTVTDDWYVLYKATDTNPATVRIANTTVEGSTSCPAIGFEIMNTEGMNGVVLGPASLADNAAVTYSLTVGGEYYVLINSPGGCSPSPAGPTFSIELEPIAEWTSGPTPPPVTATATPGTSMNTAGGPLLGNVIYNGNIPTGTINDWYVFYKAEDTNPATVRFANTTIRDSTTCPTVGYELETSGGIIEGPASLGDNSADVFTVTVPGAYYLLVNLAGGCSPSPAGATYTIELEPSAEWTSGPSPEVPEAGVAVALPVTALALVGGFIFLQRRSRRLAASGRKR